MEHDTVIHSQLREQIDKFINERAMSAVRGHAIPRKTVDIVVFTEGVEAKKAVATFLEIRGTNLLSRSPKRGTRSDHYKTGGISALVPMELIPQIAEIPQVKTIQEAHLEPG